VPFFSFLGFPDWQRSMLYLGDGGYPAAAPAVAAASTIVTPMALERQGLVGGFLTCQARENRFLACGLRECDYRYLTVYTAGRDMPLRISAWGRELESGLETALRPMAHV